MSQNLFHPRDSELQPRDISSRWGRDDHKDQGWNKKGLAGLIVMVLILGYLMAIGTSNSLMVQSQAVAEGSRQSFKRAQFAAIAGIQFVVGRLRADPADPWTTNARLYFTFDANCTCGLHRRKMGGGNTLVGYSLKTQVKGKQTFASDHVFTINTDEDPTSCKFTVCTYPGIAQDTDYYVKSQGMYQDPARNIFKAQVWAFLAIDNGTKNVTLKKWGQMSVQPLDQIYPSTTEIDDFWDQQEVFY